jgi:hypothetical protein
MKDTYTMRKVRANIEEALLFIVKESFRQGISANRVLMYLDNLIDFCECIDVYDKGELREIYCSRLKEVILDESHKEKH